ncbi:hypothetical protein CA260_17900 [Dyella jiangningensis]|uniref:Uncharacterized protein n=2 Tax=Dyella jiangningensis TaxID=1379159 RepID=A0A328P137_9GAMM|nr:hypothetical protein CA260_17900 [Dyella jiangningensis]
MIAFRVREMSQAERRRMMLAGVPILAATWVAALGHSAVVYLPLLVVVILIYTFFYGMIFRALEIAEQPQRRIRFYAGVIGVELVCIAVAFGVHSLLV